MEISGKTPTLCCGNAGTWYGYKYDEYKRGLKPQIGAVICYSHPGYYGHVAIVEEINPDGSIKISESGTSYPKTNPMSFKTVSPPDYLCDWMTSPTYNLGSSYVFQGFIYNPSCSDMKTAFNSFMDVVLKSANKNGDGIRAKYNLSKKENWNVLFPSYCASVAKIKNLMPTKKSATDFVKSAVTSYGAKWHDGPQLNDNSYVAKPGDIVCIVSDSTKSKTNKYYTDRISIVAKDTHIAGKSYIVYAVEGDVDDKVKQTIYTNSNTLIKGYIELDWNRVNVSRSGSAYSAELYDTLNDKDDAILREVSFISNNKPIINKSDIRLSVINYTSQLAAIFKYLGASVSSDALYDNQEVIGNIIFNNPMTYGGATSQCLQTNGSRIFDEFIRAGISAAGAVGIMSYMWGESRWDPAAINMWENQPWEYRGRGLGQWSLGRAVAFVAALPDWQTNLTGQVRYCVNEIQTSYVSLYNFIKNSPNTKQGAIDAAKRFTLSFGAGIGFDIPLAEAEQRFYNHYGQVNWNPHILPAEWMWDHNITSIVRNNEESGKFLSKSGKVVQEVE